MSLDKLFPLSDIQWLPTAWRLKPKLLTLKAHLPPLSLAHHGLATLASFLVLQQTDPTQGLRDVHLLFPVSEHCSPDLLLAGSFPGHCHLLRKGSSDHPTWVAPCRQHSTP